ncbi:hypothetical protein RFI_20917 [Reticulomyxa filosa]|uniref:PH domain-containing protein n=1 Tax=Reticulomyxa filosa TaxID=46433 RepID=X6MSL5_RETFI|nr:hypothetical protein RFI_20917 [Reticulomyxa filosa]|eukprot:ETO16422.1 hypothetical protein RFI_20917 [Reticulomyxa filosa]
MEKKSLVESSSEKDTSLLVADNQSDLQTSDVLNSNPFESDEDTDVNQKKIKTSYEANRTSPTFEERSPHDDKHNNDKIHPNTSELGLNMEKSKKKRELIIMVGSSQKQNKKQKTVEEVIESFLEEEKKDKEETYDKNKKSKKKKKKKEKETSSNETTTQKALENSESIFDSFDKDFEIGKTTKQGIHELSSEFNAGEMSDDEYDHLQTVFSNGSNHSRPSQSNPVKSNVPDSIVYPSNKLPSKARQSEPLKSVPENKYTKKKKKKQNIKKKKTYTYTQSRNNDPREKDWAADEKTNDTHLPHLKRPTVPVPKPPSKQAPKPPIQQFDCLPELKRGTALVWNTLFCFLKYGKQGSPHFRQFNLSQNNDELIWYIYVYTFVANDNSKGSNEYKVDWIDIDEVVVGQNTKEFQRIAWTTLEPASFTIWYDGHKRSLNVVAKSVDEMKMWVEALQLLQQKACRGEDLSALKSLEVSVDFKDRSRPHTRKRSSDFIRSHEMKDDEFDPAVQRRLMEDLRLIANSFHHIKESARNDAIQVTLFYSQNMKGELEPFCLFKSHEGTSINQILSELEERIDELQYEFSNTRNTKIAENDVWRVQVDLHALQEKIAVLIRESNKKKRRFSIF